MASIAIQTEVGNEETPEEQYLQCAQASATVIEVKSVYVRYVSEINTVDQTFKIAVDYDFEWEATAKDLESWEAGAAAQKEYQPEVWPSFVFPNSKECTAVKGAQANGNPFYIDPTSGKNCLRVLVEATGIVLYDLHAFPFDCQSLKLTMEMTFNSREKMMFVPTENQSQNVMVWNTAFSASPDFDFRRGLVEFVFKNDFSLVVLQLQVARRPMGYLFRIAVPLCLLSLIAVVAFAFRIVQDFGDRVSFLVTLILTFVAFAFVINQELPKVPYLTLLDKYNLTCFSLVVLLLGAVALLKIIPMEESLRTEVDVYFCICFIACIAALNVGFCILAVRARNKELQKLKMSSSDLAALSKDRPAITAKASDITADSQAARGTRGPFLAIASS